MKPLGPLAAALQRLVDTLDGAAPVRDNGVGFDMRHANRRFGDLPLHRRTGSGKAIG